MFYLVGFEGEPQGAGGLQQGEGEGCPDGI